MIFPTLRWILCLLAGASLVTAAEPQADLRVFVKEALARGEKRIVIPPGIYRLGLDQNPGVIWMLKGLRDVEIIADGVTLVGTQLGRALHLDQCFGVTLQGLTVDYDPIPFTQGVVAAVDPANAWIDVKIHDGYLRTPYSRVDVIDPQTRYRKKGMPFLWGSKAEMAGDDTVRVLLSGIGKTAKLGDLISLSTGQLPTAAPHAICLERCEKTTFRNVTVHSAPGMGILEVDGEGGATFTGCKIVPGARPAGATEERLLSTSWDAFQSKTIRKGPHIEDCEIREAGDDSWSVQSADFLVLKEEGSTVILASRDQFTMGVQLGDRLRTQVGGPEFTITAIRPIPQAEANLDPEIMEKTKTKDAWSHWKASPKWVEAKLDRDAGLMAGDSVYSPDRMGNGFVFKNNHIHSPGRVLIKAGGLMEGNELDTPHAVIVCAEVPSLAAAGIENLVIRNNIIRRSGWFCAASWSSQVGALSLTSTASASALRPTPVFKDVIIENNTFDACSGPNLVISSATNVTIQGNRFLNAQMDAANDTGASYGIPARSVVWLTECDGVRYEGNQIEGLGSFAGEAVQCAKGVKNAQGFPVK